MDKVKYRYTCFSDSALLSSEPTSLDIKLFMLCFREQIIAEFEHKPLKIISQGAPLRLC